MFGGTSRPGAYQSIGFGQTSDAVFLPGFFAGGATGDLKLTEAWGVRGAFNHNWDPYWSTSLWGSYAQVRYGGDALDITLGQGSVLRELQRRQGCVCRLYLQPGLQRRPGRRGHPLDSRQEPDVLG